VVKRFEDIFERNGLDKDEVKFIGAFIRSNRPHIVTAKNTWIDRIARYFYKRIAKFKALAKRLS
jgi:hypothetical protein